MSPRKRRDTSDAAFEHFAAGSGVGARIDALGPTGDEADRIIRVPLHALVASRDQPRAPITPESVSDLVRQIRGVELLNPVTVCPIMSDDGVVERYEIVAGHRRVEAFRLLAAEDPQYGTVPVIVKNFDELAKVVATQVENLGRLGLSVWEKARGIVALRRALDAAGQASTVDAIREKLGEVIGRGGQGEAGDEDGSNAPSRGGVSQYGRIGEIVTEELFRKAGGTVSDDPNEKLDYALISKLKHEALMRVVRAAAEERVEVLRQVLTEYRAPATRRARRAVKRDAIGAGAPEPSSSAMEAEETTLPVDLASIPTGDAAQRLSPEQAREALEQLLPAVATLAEVARNGQMVLTADAGSLLVAFVRTADPNTAAGRFVRDTLAARVAEHHANLSSQQASAVAAVASTARGQRV